MVDEFEANKNPLKSVNVLKAIRWTIQAWNSITADTIIHCWQHSTIIPRPSEAGVPTTAPNPTTVQA